MNTLEELTGRVITIPMGLTFLLAPPLSNDLTLVGLRNEEYLKLGEKKGNHLSVSVGGADLIIIIIIVVFYSLLYRISGFCKDNSAYPLPF